ncbi:MAG: sugar transferase [Akkermansiaceae bacterium]|nr:sugar transferase [Akkermansiaceae bacterium]
MIRLRHKMLIHVFRLFDQLVMVAAAIGIIYFRPEIFMQGGTHILEATFQFEDAIGMLILLVGWIGIFDYFIRYRADRLVALHTQLKNLLKATSLAAFWLMVISALFSVKSFNILNILIFYVLVTVIGVFSRLFLRILLLSARRSGYNYRYLLVIGANERSGQIAAKIEQKPELGYKIVGFVSETPETAAEWRARPNMRWNILGTLDELRQIFTRERVDEVIVCLPVDARFRDIAAIIQNARELGIVVRLMPEFADGYLLKNLHIEEFEEEYVITLFREQMLLQLLLKRGIDAAISLMVLVILFPMLVLVAILIKLTSPGPVFFVQNRVGMNQRQFKLYKFRSMVADAEERKSELLHLNERDGPAFKIDNDPRITPIGRFIRKTSIDELPQLFNVLSGEMSLVGPRPPLPDEVRKYEWLFRKRLSVKPGITCIWQISGRNHVSFERWMQMDHEYIENWSIWLDLRILLKTIPAVLFSRGAS